MFAVFVITGGTSRTSPTTLTWTVFPLVVLTLNVPGAVAHP